MKNIFKEKYGRKKLVINASRKLRLATTVSHLKHTLRRRWRHNTRRIGRKNLLSRPSSISHQHEMTETPSESCRTSTSRRDKTHHHSSQRGRAIRRKRGEDKWRKRRLRSEKSRPLGAAVKSLWSAASSASQLQRNLITASLDDTQLGGWNDVTLVRFHSNNTNISPEHVQWGTAQWNDNKNHFSSFALNKKWKGFRRLEY